MRVYTKATDRLRELHKNYGGAKSGNAQKAMWFDNTDQNDDIGNFNSMSLGSADISTYVRYKQLSEQEFIDFMDLETKDNVNSPSHYTNGSIECVDAIKESMSKESFLGYLKGNVQKYLWRYEKKLNPVEDLKKASWYLNKLITEREQS